MARDTKPRIHSETLAGRQLRSAMAVRVDCDMGSFTTLYRSWILADMHDRGIERELSEAYQSAWVSGDEEDRYCVLHYIFQARHAPGFALIVEGMRSDEPWVARDSALMASSLIRHGFDLGPRVRRVFEEFGQRYPEWAGVSREVLGRTIHVDNPEEP